MRRRKVGNGVGLSPYSLHYDGLGGCDPPDSEYDLERARRTIWAGRTPETPPALPPPSLSDEERRSLSFPAVGWLDATLAKLPSSTLKILAPTPLPVILAMTAGQAIVTSAFLRYLYVFIRELLLDLKK